jgi:hypothetical protein
MEVKITAEAGHEGGLSSTPTVPENAPTFFRRAVHFWLPAMNSCPGGNERTYRTHADCAFGSLCSPQGMKRTHTYPPIGVCCAFVRSAGWRRMVVRVVPWTNIPRNVPGVRSRPVRDQQLLEAHGVGFEGLAQKCGCQRPVVGQFDYFWSWRPRPARQARGGHCHRAGRRPGADSGRTRQKRYRSRAREGWGAKGWEGARYEAKPGTAR